MHLKVHVSNTLYLSSYCINKDTVKNYYDLIIRHKPVAIEGYPSSLYTLALCMSEAGLKLDIPVAFTSNETLLDYQRTLIEKQLGTEIYDNYGMTEQTYIFKSLIIIRDIMKCRVIALMNIWKMAKFVLH